jgi:hypothetical protein
LEREREGLRTLRCVRVRKGIWEKGGKEIKV